MRLSIKMVLVLALLMTIIPGVSGPVGAAKKFEGVTLSFIVPSAPDDDVFRQQIATFEQKTGARVVFEAVPYGQMFGKLVLGLKSGSYDVFAADYQWIPQLVKSGSVAPLDKYIIEESADVNLKDFAKPVLEAYKIEGVTYGLPWYANVNIGVVRESLLAKSGLSWPDDWDGFLTLAKKLTCDTNGDGKVDIYGAVVAGGRHPHLATEYRQYLWSFGSEFLDEDFNPAFDNERGVAALQYMIDLIQKHKVAPPASVNYNYEDGLVAFAQGNVATAWTWPTTVAMLKDPAKSKVIDDFQVVPRPGVPISSPWGFAVAKKSQAPEAAFELVKWLSSREALLQWAKKGYPVARTSVLLDPEVAKTIPYMDVIEKSLAKSKVMPSVPYFEELRDNLIRYLSSALAGSMSAKDAIKRSAEVATELAKKYR